MSDPEETATETPAGEQETMRPIPDGGLQASMPEWLRRPPAWRNLPKREEPAATAGKELPPPDTSGIDPRSLVDVSDLPQWLQDIAARSADRPQGQVDSTAPVPTDASRPKETEMTERDKEPIAENNERTVSFEPVDKKAWEAPEHETRTYGGGEPKKGTSPVLIGMIALAAVVILVLLLIAFL